MEGFLSIFTIVGMMSLYLVIATLVGKGIYSAGKKINEDCRSFIAILGGVLFPISVPICVAVMWIYSIVNIPLQEVEDPKKTRELNTCQRELERTKTKVKNLQGSEVKKVFKVGDILTGVSGNPGNYKHLYEGCVCRVLQINKDGQMQLILLDHKDKEAHKRYIGRTFTAPDRNFTLVKQPVKKRK